MPGVLDESKYAQPRDRITPASQRVRIGMTDPNNPRGVVDTPWAAYARQYYGNSFNPNAVPKAYDMMQQSVGANPSSAAINSLKNYATSGSSGGGRRGGGSGGGSPGITQAQMDWLAGLLKAGKPQAESVNPFVAPEYTGMAMRAFDPSQYDQLSTNFGNAVNQDRASIDMAYNNADQYLQNNYRNAFAAGPPAAPQQGMNQDAMARLMQSQGINPNNNQQLNNLQQGTAAGNAAFGNLWGILGANEDTNQANRLIRSQQDRATSNQALNAAALQGTTGIGLQRAKAQGDWQKEADARAYADYQTQQQLAQQAAMQNWQRANQVQDTNATNAQGWNSSTIQALMGLLGKFQGNFPDLASLGLA